jgi:site-specific DNA recombinase
MRVALYTRVSTDEQATSGYSIADQQRQLSDHAERNGYEVVETIVDDGYSGASPNRPGLVRITELAESGAIDLVLATKRDRLFRSRLYRLLMDQDLEGYGVRLVALNDTGNRIGDGVQDDYAEWERETFMERSRAGKRERAKQGKVIPSGNNLPYGYQYNHDRSNYVVRPDQMNVVRRMFEMVGHRKDSLKAVCKALDSEGVPTPGGSPYWNPITVRRFLLDDRYKPHTIDELRALGISADVLDRLDAGKRYGVTYYGQTRTTKRRTRRKNASDKPREIRDDRIPIPIPDSGIPREWVDSARRYFETYRGWRDKAGGRFYELRGFVYCGACGRKMTSAHNNGYFYYSCQARRNHGYRACPDSKNFRADGKTGLEWEIARDVGEFLRDSSRVVAELDAAIAAETAATRNPHTEAATWVKVIQDCDRQRSGYQDLAAAGLMTLDELAAKLRVIDERKSAAERQLKDARDGTDRVEELRATKRAFLGAYASGILYDGIEHFTPEMRHEIYGALGLRVTANPDGTTEVEYQPTASVIRLTREVEDYGAEVAAYRGKLTQHSIPVDKPLRASSS